MWREDISMKHVNRILGSVLSWKRSIRFWAQSACTNAPWGMCGDHRVDNWLKDERAMQFEALIEELLLYSKGT